MSIAIVGFSKKDAARASTGTLRKVRAGMRRDGAVIFDGLFPRRLLNALRRDVMRRHDSGQLRRRGLVRDIGGRYAALVPFEGPFLRPEFYANPRLTGLLAALLGPDYCIGSLEAVVSLPGASRQHQHIDGPIRFDQAAGRGKRAYRGDLSDLPPYAVTLCVPLCDLDETNGATVVWPGSHRAALRPRPPGLAEVRRKFAAEQMVGAFGRSFLFDYRTFHCGMPNYSREPRPLLMFVFTRRWFRDPNLTEVVPNVVISRKNLDRIPQRRRDLFMLAPAARRRLWT